MEPQTIIEEIIEEVAAVKQSNPEKPPIYCAKCFHSFCVPQPESDSNMDSDIDDVSDSESDDSISPIFREEDPEDIEERMLEEIEEYVQSNPLAIWRASYEKDLVKDISVRLMEEWAEDDLCEESDLPEIQEWVKQMAEYYFKTESEMPPRQGGAPLPVSPLRTARITHKLRLLSNQPTHSQKTQEWYETRYGLLTASNVWKALGTESQQNQLIVEKCTPFEKFKEDCSRHGNLSADNPMSWGQKYEPISALIYEKKNHTRLGEYGCIVHPKWRFLGASPDGINIEPATSPGSESVYGRMVEIKNIVNRNIDGIPLDAYWVQMQIQMEVCDLDECDFVETRIKEFQHKYEFFESQNPWKGIVLTFVPRIKIGSGFERQPDQKQFYEYFLLDPAELNPGDAVEKWIQSKKDQYQDFVLFNGVYWGLDQYSCVLVKRNRAWFQAAIPQIERVWRIIERERITGCEHRAPKKREPKPSTESTQGILQINKLEE